MVDRIDRPEANPLYQITRPKDAKEDQHKEPDQREEQEKRYQKELSESSLNKLEGPPVRVKPLRVRREDITRMTFRGVGLKSGTTILRVNVIWKDGRTQPAFLAFGKMDEYLKLKDLKMGEDVPKEFWALTPYVDMGVVVSDAIPSAKAKPNPSKPQSISFSKKGMTYLREHKVHWGLLALYVFLATIALIAFIIR